MSPHQRQILDARSLARSAVGVIESEWRSWWWTESLTPSYYCAISDLHEAQAQIRAVVDSLDDPDLIAVAKLDLKTGEDQLPEPGWRGFLEEHSDQPIIWLVYRLVYGPLPRQVDPCLEQGKRMLELIERACERF